MRNIYSKFWADLISCWGYKNIIYVKRKKIDSGTSNYPKMLCSGEMKDVRWVLLWCQFFIKKNFIPVEIFHYLSSLLLKNLSSESQVTAFEDLNVSCWALMRLIWPHPHYTTVTAKKIMKGE